MSKRNAVSVTMLADDLRHLFDEATMRPLMNEIVEDALMRVKMISTFPIDTKRLNNSGFGYVGGTLVAQTDEGDTSSTKTNKAYPIDPPPRVSHRKNVMTIIFRATKPAKDAAKVFHYGEPYGKQFDYAPMVLGGAVRTHQIFDPRRAIETIIRGITAKWSSQR